MTLLGVYEPRCQTIHLVYLAFMEANDFQTTVVKIKLPTAQLHPTQAFAMYVAMYAFAMFLQRFVSVLYFSANITSRFINTSPPPHDAALP